VYLVIVESMQVGALEKLAELRKILKAKYFVVAGKGFEVERRLLRIGVVSKGGQVVSQVAIAEIVDAGAAESERVESGL
jgi:hypothetical protein